MYLQLVFSEVEENITKQINNYIYKHKWKDILIYVIYVHTQLLEHY